jgi:S1-C subfamily serine protease
MVLALWGAAAARAGMADKVDGQWVGMEASAASEALRAQLDVPAGEGFVVEKVFPDTPAAKAGIQRYDVLLRADGTPLHGIGDLAAQIDNALLAELQKGADEKLAIELLRAGKRQTVTFKPAVSIRFVHVVCEHWLGVEYSLSDPGGALRAQLNLPAGQGSVVDSVLSGSPAAQAGIRPCDILLQVNDKPLRGGMNELLTEINRDVKDNKLAIELLRGGKRQTLTVAPARRPAFVQDGSCLVFFYYPGKTVPPGDLSKLPERVRAKVETIVHRLEAAMERQSRQPRSKP